MPSGYFCSFEHLEIIHYHLSLFHAEVDCFLFSFFPLPVFTKSVKREFEYEWLPQTKLLSSRHSLFFKLSDFNHLLQTITILDSLIHRDFQVRFKFKVNFSLLI